MSTLSITVFFLFFSAAAASQKLHAGSSPSAHADFVTATVDSSGNVDLLQENDNEDPKHKRARHSHSESVLQTDTAKQNDRNALVRSDVDANGNVQFESGAQDAEEEWAAHASKASDTGKAQAQQPADAPEVESTKTPAGDVVGGLAQTHSIEQTSQGLLANLHLHSFVGDGVPVSAVIALAISMFVAGIAVVMFISDKSSKGNQNSEEARRPLTFTEVEPGDSMASRSTRLGDMFRGSNFAESLENAVTRTAEMVDDGLKSMSFGAIADPTSDEDANEGRDGVSLEDLLRKWDFEEYDALEKKTRRWQWCTPDEIHQLGLLVQAPTRSYIDRHGHKFIRDDVQPTQRAVKKMLEGAGISFDRNTGFDVDRDMETLVFKILKAEAYFMTRDDDADDGQLMLMIESVRLRWSYQGKVLVQKRDHTLLGKKPNFPGLEKPASESPIITAKRMWEVMFKLPAGSAQFLQESVDDVEMQGFRGIHCVERSHIVEVKLEDEEEFLEALKVVGVPEHSDFSTSADPSEDFEVTRNFQWLGVYDCKTAGMKVNENVVAESDTGILMSSTMSMASQGITSQGFGGTSSQGLASLSLGAKKLKSQGDLKTFLEAAGLDIQASNWTAKGKSGGSKLESLEKELAQSKCYLTKTNLGVHRCVNVVAVRMWSPDRNRMLVDKGRLYQNGEEEWTAQLPGAKKDGIEDIKSAAQRICETQLGLEEEQFSFSDDSAWEYFDYSETSSRYTGLLTKYQKFFVDVILDDDEELQKRVGLMEKSSDDDIGAATRANVANANARLNMEVSKQSQATVTAPAENKRQSIKWNPTEDDTPQTARGHSY